MRVSYSMPDVKELEKMFKRILGAGWISVVVYANNYVSVQARKISWLDSGMLEDIEANGFFIEQWFFDTADGGIFMAHLRQEADAE